MPDTTANLPIAVRNPWVWVPSLYFAQGIPYVMAMTVSVIMYKRLGISNTDIALYTSWLYLPWVLKPLWSPAVDLLGTKRRWIVIMQALIGAILALVAFSIPAPRFFQYTIGLFWVMAFASATHDIAADGFYMLGLRQHQQAAFVGVRSTFYRIATLAAQGLLVVLAGLIETHSGMGPVRLNVSATANVVEVASQPAATTAQPESQGPQLIAVPADQAIDPSTGEAANAQALLKKVRQENVRNGFLEAAHEGAGHGSGTTSWWARHISEPAAQFLRKHFGDPRRQAFARGGGSVGVAALRLTEKPAGSRNIVVLLNRDSGEGIEIAEGTRLVFNERNWNEPALVAFSADPRIKGTTHASFTATSGNIPLAWSTVAATLAVLFVVFCVYHKFALPVPMADGPARSEDSRGFLSEFFRTFVVFFKRRDIAVVVGFLLFFRFAEAQLVKLVSPFLLDPRDVGGLGLSTEQVGVVYGTIGIAALTVGGLLGGYLISRQGLRFWLWPMVFIMHLPDLAFVYLSYWQPENLWLVTAAVATEQFGYGFGFTAYMLYMIMVAEGPHKTAHYAICTGFMALGMMLPGMFSGWLQEIVGYPHFFLWVVISTIPGFLVAALVRIDPEFGRKQLEAAAQPSEARLQAPGRPDPRDS